MNYTASFSEKLQSLNRLLFFPSACAILIVGSLYFCMAPASALFAALSSYPVLQDAGSPPAQHFGSQDFIEYWAASRLAAEGHNFYDPAEMLAAERAVDKSRSVPLMMWNPPWNIFYFIPLRSLSFSHAAYVFLWLNVFALILSIILIVRSFERCLGHSIGRGELLLVVASTLSFVPVWECLSLGQLGILLLAACSGSFYFLSRKKYSRAGACLALASVKPHLTVLLVIAIACWSLKSKNLRLIGGYALTILFFVVASLFYVPNALFDWFQATFLTSGNDIAPNVQEWRVASLGLLAKEFSNWSGLSSPAAGPLILLSSSAVVFSYWFITREKRHVWSLDFPPILALSVLIAPVAWVSDQVLFLPLLIGIIVLSSTKPTPSASGLVFALSALLFISSWLRHSLLSSHHQFWWLGVPIVLLWQFAKWERPNGRSQSQ